MNGFTIAQWTNFTCFGICIIAFIAALIEQSAAGALASVGMALLTAMTIVCVDVAERQLIVGNNSGQ